MGIEWITFHLITLRKLMLWVPTRSISLICFHWVPTMYRLLLNKRALGPWVIRPRMTDQWSGTICEILEECIMRNNSVKLFWIWVSGSGADVVLKISYLELGQSSCLVQLNHLCNFERRHHGEYLCEVIWNLNQWFKRRCRLETFLI